MFAIIGLVVLFACVFGGYVLAGGKMAPILKALPFEMMIIGGAGVGAMVISNSLDVLKGVGAGIGKVFGGPKYHKQEYMDTIFLVVKLFKVFKAEGAVALESHIENPEASSIFGEYPKLLKDHSLINMIAGLVPIDSGEILFDGKSLKETRIGYVFQNYREALFPWMRTIDNIAYPLKLEKRSKAEVDRRVAELVESFDVKFDLRRYPYELSGGQQQTASIMRALAGMHTGQ